MKKFEFSLDSIQKLREQNLSLEQLKYAEAARAVVDQKKVIEEMRAKFADENAKFKSESGDTNTTQLNLMRQYLIYLQNRIEQEIVVLSRLELKEAEARESMINARVESKSLDVLYEQQYDQYVEESQKKERDNIEEMLSARYFR